MKVITKDMWKGNPEDLIGVWVKLSYMERCSKVISARSSLWEITERFIRPRDFVTNVVRIITPEERPDLYPEYFNQKEILPVNKIDHDQYQCDFTKPMWLNLGQDQYIEVQPEDIVIVRKNQVCLIDTRNDQLRDAMAQDFTNTKPKMSFEDFVEVLTTKCDSHKSVAYFFRNSGLIKQDADFEDALEKFLWNK